MTRHMHVELHGLPDVSKDDGDSGYELIAPLSADGSLDCKFWHEEPARYRVRRVRRGEADDCGLLVRRTDGLWAFRFLGHDEVLVSHTTPVLRESGVLWVREFDGAERPFRVTRVAPADSQYQRVPELEGYSLRSGT